MEFSATGIIIGLALVAFVCALLLTYIVRGVIRERRESAQQTYRWQPETDYDVVHTGEGPMTPAFPELKEKKPKSASRDRSARS